MNRRSRLFSDWRDFGREYVIVVLGVLTALLAQQVVEDVGWSQKVDAAIADMDQELSNGNGPQAYVRLVIFRCLDERLSALRGAIQRGDRVEVIRRINDIQLPLRSWNSFARQAANASDIVSRMPRSVSNEYRIVYSLTPELDDVHHQELQDLAQLRAIPTGTEPLSIAEKLSALEAIENLIIDNQRMRRGSAFTLRHMRELGVGITRDQVARNFADVPAYSGCLTRSIKSDIDQSPPTVASAS
jgi:hypothetical protein